MTVAPARLEQPPVKRQVLGSNPSRYANLLLRVGGKVSRQVHTLEKMGSIPILRYQLRGILWML